MQEKKEERRVLLLGVDEITYSRVLGIGMTVIME